MPPPLALHLPEAIRRIADAPDRRIAWEFFVFFSRFEYALKRQERFLLPGRGNAEPNWDRFASDYSEPFLALDLDDLRAAIAFYASTPPRRQLRANGAMTWSEPQYWDQREPRLVWLLRAVRAVRNNLFHGGKFPLIPISDPSRDGELLTHAITILSSCLTLNDDVAESLCDGLDP